MSSLPHFIEQGFLAHTLANPLQCDAEKIRLDNGVTLSLWATGVLRISPAQTGTKRVLISCGIHGNETAPMEIVEQLFQEIVSTNLAVNNELLLLIGNPPSAIKAQRFVDENLNRLFSGAYKRSQNDSNETPNYECQRAELIEESTQRFFNEGDQHRFHYDLHTAIRGSYFQKFAVCPFLHERSYSKTQLGFLERCGLAATLLSNEPSGTYSYYTSASFETNSFTVELGSVQSFGENDMSQFQNTVAGLRGLINGEETFALEAKDMQVFSVVEEVIKRSDAFRLHFPDDAKNFTKFPKGTLLASDVGYEYRTKQEGERFVFPIINVPLGQRAMLVVAPVKS